MVGVIFIAECFMLWRIRSDRFGALAIERNFYGTLRVVALPPMPPDRPGMLQLNHGNINHGYQYLDEKLSRVPVSYYGDTSGVDTAVRRHPRRLADPPKPLRIGVLGLGTGTMAAFGETGDLVRFYEINPAVIRYSTAEKPFFTYLRDSKARHRDRRRRRPALARKGTRQRPARKIRRARDGRFFQRFRARPPAHPRGLRPLPETFA